MFKKLNKRRLLALLFNIALVILELVGFYLSINKHNKLLVKYYTQNSNLLALVASCLFIIFSFINILNNKFKIPRWIKNLRYMATCSLSLTLFMVLLTPLPISNKDFIKVMVHDSSLYLHTLCPIISILSFILFEEYDKKGVKDILVALSFTFIYGFVIVSANVLKILEGPYPFLLVYNQPIYVTILYIVSILFCAGVIAKLLLISNISITKMLSNKNGTN